MPTDSRPSSYRVSRSPSFRSEIAAAALAVLAFGLVPGDAQAQEAPAFVWQTGAGRLAPRATSAAFEAETVDGSEKARRTAKCSFDAAEREYSAEAYEEAVRQYRNSVEGVPTMAALLNLGHGLVRLGQPAPALRAFQEGLSKAQAVEDTLYSAAFLEHIANVYADGKKPGEAFQSYAPALDLYRSAGDVLGEGYTLINMASVYGERGSVAKANSDLADVRSLFEREKPAPEAFAVLARAYRELGDVHVRADSLDRALANYSSAVSLFREAGSEERAVEVEASIDSLESAGAGPAR